MASAWCQCTHLRGRPSAHGAHPVLPDAQHPGRHAARRRSPHAHAHAHPRWHGTATRYHPAATPPPAPPRRRCPHCPPTRFFTGAMRLRAAQAHRPAARECSRCTRPLCLGCGGGAQACLARCMVRAPWAAPDACADVGAAWAGWVIGVIVCLEQESRQTMSKQQEASLMQGAPPASRHPPPA